MVPLYKRLAALRKYSSRKQGARFSLPRCLLESAGPHRQMLMERHPSVWDDPSIHGYTDEADDPHDPVANYARNPTKDRGRELTVFGREPGAYPGVADPQWTLTS